MRSMFREVSQFLYRNNLLGQEEDIDDDATQECTMTFSHIRDMFLSVMYEDLLVLLNLLHTHCPEKDRQSISSADVLPEVFHIIGILSSLSAHNVDCSSFLSVGWLNKLPIPFNMVYESVRRTDS